METFCYGPADRRLFGAFYPQCSGGANRAALVCHALGHEYMRSHRSILFLAGRLAAAGIDTFLFDYYGTGDSEGSGNDVTSQGTLDDATLALAELEAISGCHRFSLIGVRYGAIPAIRLAELNAKRIERLTLWDPILNGANYLQTLDELNKHLHHDLERFPPGRHIVASSNRLGFDYSASLVKELADFDALALLSELTQKASVHIVSSPSQVAFYQSQIGDLCAPGALSISSGQECYWSELALVEVALLPSQTTQLITEWNASR
jgi:pimeloyl-ACP methyl ester carboxylesterase